MSDVTLKDLGRREISLTTSLIQDVLPEYFREDNPKLISFLERYYRTLDSDHSISSAGEMVSSQRQREISGATDNNGNVIQHHDSDVGLVGYSWDSDRNFGYQLHNLPTLRDVSQTDKENLTFIEDELLLGQNYIEGALDQRTGAELSNNFYRSKGTKFGIERFFKLFFGETPEVVYGKDLVMKVGDKIGPESGLYITNDTIYQFWGLLIKVGISSSVWFDLYKLFAHPGGMYAGASVLIEGVNTDISFNNMPISIEDVNLPTFEGQAFLAPKAMLSASGIIGTHRYPYDSANTGNLTGRTDTTGGRYRIDLDKSSFEDYATVGGTDSDANRQGTLRGLDNMFGNIVDIVRINSQTMDADSSRGVLRFSTDQVTIDADKFKYNSDSA